MNATSAHLIHECLGIIDTSGSHPPWPVRNSSVNAVARIKRKRSSGGLVRTTQVVHWPAC
jgi:hypothetical protein